MHQGPPPFGLDQQARKDWLVKCNKMLNAPKPVLPGIGEQHVAAPSCAENLLAEEEARAPAAQDAAPAAAEALHRVTRAADNVQQIQKRNAQAKAAAVHANRGAATENAMFSDEDMWKPQLQHLAGDKLDCALGWLRAGFSMPTADLMGLQCKTLQVVADSKEVAEQQKQGKMFTACVIDNVDWASADWKGGFLQRWKLRSDLTHGQLLAALDKWDTERSWTDKRSWEELCKARGTHGDAEDGPTDDDQTCEVCDDPGELLICDRCEKGFHLACVKPKPLTAIPKGDWSCHTCLQGLEEARRKCVTCKKALGKLGRNKPIYCGSCEHFFHLKCVGLSSVPKAKGWKCPTCSRTSSQVGHFNDGLG